MSGISMKIHNSLIRIGGIGLCAAALVWLGVSLLGSNDAASGQTPASTTSALVSLELTSGLAIVRRIPTAEDTLPNGLEHNVANAGAQVGAEISAAKLAFVGKTGPVYVVPGTGGVCLVNASKVSDFCSPTAEVLSGQATSGVACAPGLPPDEVETSGLLPDGVSDVRVTMSDGTTQPVNVTGNAYQIYASQSAPLPETITWQSGGVTHSTSTNLPPDSATVQCKHPPIG